MLHLLNPFYAIFRDIYLEYQHILHLNIYSVSSAEIREMQKIIVPGCRAQLRKLYLFTVLQYYDFSKKKDWKLRVMIFHIKLLGVTVNADSLVKKS